MAVVRSRVQRIEAQLVEFHQRINELDQQKDVQQLDAHINQTTTLENAIDFLSIKSKEKPILTPGELIEFISNFRKGLITFDEATVTPDVPFARASDLLWLVAAKASLQTLAIILKELSENVLSLSEEIIYWEDVLDSPWYIGLYTLQTSPFNLWLKLKRTPIFGPLYNVFKYENDAAESGIQYTASASSSWARFYRSVQQSLLPTHMPSCFRRMPSPLVKSRMEIRRKKRNLKIAKDFNASAIGLLLENCLSFSTNHHSSNGRLPGFAPENLRNTITESVSLIETLLQEVKDNDGLPGFKSNLFLVTDENLSQTKHQENLIPRNLDVLVDRLVHILGELLPRYNKFSVNVTNESGRPSSPVRYWLPLLLGVISGSLSLNYLRNQFPAIIKWVGSLGSTTVEFWNNWVVEPTWKLIRTIRHDETSEIALTSKNSLEADRGSLERMVVDFVLDRGDPRSTSISTDAIAIKVREGDLTPVLKAYEKDLRTPFIGTVRGDLVRALLIQIQKTKVDVEIAIGGIDALLKSQELVFGFVGLTPGILVSYASVRWFCGLLGNRKGFRVGRQHDNLRYALRNIHRSLTLSGPTIDGLLTYKNHGLLVCNIEILLRKAEVVLKGEDLLAFQEDIADLVNENHIDRRLRIVERMAWTYSKWT